MDLRCPQCNSTDLKKLSLAYQEGISHVNARTRLRGVVVGSDGPDLVVGSGTSTGTMETDLSKSIAPPVKWSYSKLMVWSVVCFLAFGWLVFYVNAVATSSQAVESLPLSLYTIFAGCIFAAVFTGFWRHNHSQYRDSYERWNRSFICNRCGAVSDQRR